MRQPSFEPMFSAKHDFFTIFDVQEGDGVVAVRKSEVVIWRVMQRISTYRILLKSK